MRRSTSLFLATAVGGLMLGAALVEIVDVVVPRAQVSALITRHRAETRISHRDTSSSQERKTTTYVAAGTTADGDSFHFEDRDLYDQTHADMRVRAEVSRLTHRVRGFHSEPVDWDADGSPTFWLFVVLFIGSGTAFAWVGVAGGERGSPMVEGPAGDGEAVTAAASFARQHHVAVALALVAVGALVGPFLSLTIDALPP